MKWFSTMVVFLFPVLVAALLGCGPIYDQGDGPARGLLRVGRAATAARGAIRPNAQWKCAGPVDGCTCAKKPVDGCSYSVGRGDTKSSAQDQALDACAETKGDPRECRCTDASELVCERATWACEGPVRGCKKIKGAGTRDCPFVTGKGEDREDAVDDARSECEVELDDYNCEQADVSGLVCAEE